MGGEWYPPNGGYAGNIWLGSLLPYLAAHHFDNHMNHIQFEFNDSSGQALVDECMSCRVTELSGENPESASYQSGELWTLLEEFLGIIIKTVGASAGAVRVLSPNGMELEMVGAIGLPSEVCERESVVGAREDAEIGAAVELQLDEPHESPPALIPRGG